MQAFNENAQNIFGRRHFDGSAFCKALPAFAFLTIETREHNSFVSLIDRWFNPTVFST
jgi:hypothetical protein